jgi:hypothetical protein
LHEYVRRCCHIDYKIVQKCFKINRLLLISTCYMYIESVQNVYMLQNNYNLKRLDHLLY